MQQPRRFGEYVLEEEKSFMSRFGFFFTKETGLDARVMKMLEAAWTRMVRSDVARAFQLLGHLQTNEVHQQRFGAAVEKSLAAPDLRSCALDECGAREAHAAHFKSCAACRAVVYCCREHQVAGWPGHKKACKAARTAAEEDDGAGPSGA